MRTNFSLKLKKTLYIERGGIARKQRIGMSEEKNVLALRERLTAANANLARLHEQLTKMITMPVSKDDNAFENLDDDNAPCTGYLAKLAETITQQEREKKSCENLLKSYEIRVTQDVY